MKCAMCVEADFNSVSLAFYVKSKDPFTLNEARQINKSDFIYENATASSSP